MPTAELDHVAVAVEHWADAFPRYAAGLGGAWHSGGYETGFSPCQLHFANAARLELLQPWDWEHNTFLRRFLDANGPGPHHVTFKVPDIEAAIAEVRSAGYDPVGILLDNPEWREAFLHPKQAPGIVVQLAQAGPLPDGWVPPPPPDDFPPVGTDPASLLRVVHAVADLEPAVELFGGLLGGRAEPARAGPDGTWRSVELSWAGPLRIRLVAPVGDAAVPSRLRAWLGGRAGRLHHLAFARTEPARAAEPAGGTEAAQRTAPAGTEAGGVPGVHPDDGSVTGVVEPGDNLGTRLVLFAAGA